MLRYLRLENLAVVRSATIELGPGLIALTGETGAGKSLLVDALTLLLGARVSNEPACMRITRGWKRIDSATSPY